MSCTKQLQQIHIPIDVIIDRVRAGEPLRWLTMEILGLSQAEPDSQMLMLGGDWLDEASRAEVDDCSSLTENGEDIDGIVTYSIR